MSTFDVHQNAIMTLGYAIIYGMLALSLAAPFVALYGAKQIRNGNMNALMKIQKGLFFTCVGGVILLELLIRISGGSGSLVQDSPYKHTWYFKPILIAHIIGAVLTYIVWAYTIFKTNKNFKKKEIPGQFSAVHRKLGYFIIFGLFYTGITAFIVCTLAFFL